MNAPDRQIQDLAERLFAGHEDPLGPAPADPLHEGLWSALVASELPTLTGSKDLAGLADACEVAREAGRTAARVPVVEAMVVAWACAECGWDAPHRARGIATYAFASEPVDAARATLDIVLPGVAYGTQAQEVVVFGGDCAFVLNTRDAQGQRGGNLADEPRDTLSFARAPVVRRAPLPTGQARALAAVLRTAAMAGAAQRTLAIALEHARTREQFGRPIATFQAVQQMLAQLAGHVALMSAAADSAATRYAGLRDPLLAAAAKAVAGEAVSAVTELAHQIVAAIGFTREHHLHRYTRRLWSWRDEDGSEFEWQQRLGAHLLASDGSLWQTVTAVMAGEGTERETCPDR